MTRQLFLPVLLLAGLAIALPASSKEPYNLVDRLVLAQRGLIAPREEKTDPEALARAIASAAKGDRILAAAMLATAYVETALSDRLRRNECRPLECDRRRAWGLYQIHKDGYTSEVWGSSDVNDQSTAAARKMKNALHTARDAHAPFPEGMFRAYGGRRVDSTVPREALRVSTFKQVLGHL
jgi:hypothetical protein